jgi:hypothetical protein
VTASASGSSASLPPSVAGVVDAVVAATSPLPLLAASGHLGRVADLAHAVLTDTRRRTVHVLVRCSGQAMLPAWWGEYACEYVCVCVCARARVPFRRGGGNMRCG